MYCIISLMPGFISIFNPLLSLGRVFEKLWYTHCKSPDHPLFATSASTPSSEPNKLPGICGHMGIKQRKPNDMLLMMNSAGKLLCITSGVCVYSSLSHVQLSHPYMTTGKNKALAVWTSVNKEMSLFFNRLSRFISPTIVHSIAIKIPVLNLFLPITSPL